MNHVGSHCFSAQEDKTGPKESALSSETKQRAADGRTQAPTLPHVRSCVRFSGRVGIRTTLERKTRRVMDVPRCRRRANKRSEQWKVAEHPTCEKKSRITSGDRARPPDGHNAPQCGAWSEGSRVL
ncbi:hypothetical protein OBV_38380 [Oscillibacter valericigenes Sjm18-20]|nr:hypothetical protein OBV_38380 [Oscillibacter valericigenes Sjm18-20]